MQTIKVIRNQKSVSEIAIRSDFFFEVTDEINVTSIFFFNGLKSLNFQNCVKRLMDCSLLGEYLRANINVSNFISLYLGAEVTLEVVL